VPAELVPRAGVVTYTITLNNPGLSSDANVVVTDALPSEVDFGGWLQNPGADVIDDRFTWSGGIAADDSLTFIFTATNTANSGAVVTNTAYFSGTQRAGLAQAAFAGARLCYLPLVMSN
jgi:uncharacterized protein DUF11